MDFYRYWNSYYGEKNNLKNDKDYLKNVVQDFIEEGYLTQEAIIDSKYKKEMLIYKHTNPLDIKQVDFKAICLDNENLNWGNMIKLKDNREFISITKPDWNGVYSKYRIRETKDDFEFIEDDNFKIKCVVADKGFYDEMSFTNEKNIFGDREIRSVLIQYNQDTKNLKIFDDVLINGKIYKIIKVDEYTLKEYDEEYGVIQLVVINTIFGEIIKNDKIKVNGLVMTARVKDKILNSISRELLCSHGTVKRGDYVSFKYNINDNGDSVIDTYLVINKPTPSEKYDTSLMYLCENTIKLLNDMGDVVNVHAYYENNRVRIDKSIENEFVKLKNSSYLIVVQQNELTNKLRNNVNRIMINGEVYKITGYETLVDGLLALGLEIDQLCPDDNLSMGIANFYSQMEKLKPTQKINKIVEVNNETTLCKGFENEYLLKDFSEEVIWEVNENWINIRQENGRCWIKFNELKYVGKTIILQAKTKDETYKISVECVSLN